MTRTANADNLRQCNSRFSLISEQVLAFASNTNLVKEVKELCPNFIMMHNDVLAYR